jgi:hypothetical protein
LFEQAKRGGRRGKITNKEKNVALGDVNENKFGYFLHSEKYGKAYLPPGMKPARINWESRWIALL